MFIGQSFFSPHFWINILRITRYTMITYKNKNRIVEPGLFLRRLDKILKTKISITECIVFFLRFKSPFLEFFLRQKFFLKCRIFCWNSERTMVVGCLNDGKKWIFLFRENRICFEIKIFVDDDPDIHWLVAETSLHIHL